MATKNTAKCVIDIPLGLEFIEAAQIPNWIADELVQVPDLPPSLVSLQKQTLLPQPGHSRLGDLTDADIDLLCSIWDVIPDRKLPYGTVSSIEYEEYRRAFRNSPNKPDWELHAVFRDHRGEAKIQRSEVLRGHWDQLNTAIRDGRLHVLTANRLPGSKVEPGSLISVAEARAYLAGIGFELREVGPHIESGATSCNGDAENGVLEGDQRGDSELTETERTRLLRHIGALALAMAEKASKYRRGDKPNALQIALEVSEILDALPDANRRGVGSSNLRESIRAGIDLLSR